MAEQAMNLRFDIGYHALLTRDANDDLLDKEQIDAVVAANVAQDLLQTQSKVHFDNCDFPGGIEHIQQEWSAIEGTMPHVDGALVPFGALLHTTQDFYAHSNWIELHADQAPVPVWDQTIASLPAGIVSGTWKWGFPKLCGPGAPTHSELNKDSPDSEEGKKIVETGPNAGRTLFDLAFATALAATKVQFARLAEQLSKDGAGAKAGPVTPFERALRASRELRANG